MDLIYTLNEIQSAAKQFLQAVIHKRVFAFHGEMGVGKTTFIHAFCNELQVKDVVSSPTFSIINEYESVGGKIYHIDLYRLTDQEDAIQAGVEDFLYSGERCLVEWPEKAAGLLPEDTVHVYLYAINGLTRRILIEDK